MSARGLYRAAPLVDRGFLLALAVLAVLGAAALASPVDETLLDPAITLPAAYERFCGLGLATCVFLPLYALGVNGEMGRLGNPASLVRGTSRQMATLRCAVALVARGAVFEVVQLTFALAAALVKAGTTFAPPDVAIFAAQQLVLGTLWFAVVGLAMLAGRLVWGWGVLAIVPAFLYAGYEVLLSLAPLPLGLEEFQMGWTLVLSADPADPLASLPGAARLATLALLLLLLCLRLSRRADFLEGGMQDDGA